MIIQPRAWRRTYLCRVLRSPSHPVLLLALVLVLCVILTAKKTVLTRFACHTIWINYNSRFKIWINCALDDTIYLGARNIRTEDSGAQAQNAEQPLSFAYQHTYSTLQAGGSESSTRLSCHDIFETSSVRAFNGSQISFPKPAFGSFDILDLNSDAFFTRFSRYGPYGLEDETLEHRRAASSRWKEVDWESLQNACVERNQATLDLRPRPALSVLSAKEHQPKVRQWAELGINLTATIPFGESKKLRSRTAIVMRAYDTFEWTDDDMVNIRAMLTELPLFSGGQYQLFVIVQIHNASEEIPSDPQSLENLKRRYVPKELLNMTELWNEKAWEIAYPKVKEYNVYNQTFMPLQQFAMKHPEYDFYWNWEMDVRYTGHYYHLLDHLSTWTKAQTRNHLWDRNAMFYVPSFHGSYEKFSKTIQSSATDPPWGPLKPDNDSTVAEALKITFPEQPGPDWGVGEDADLITLFPISDPIGTVWPWRDHLINYNAVDAAKPRRTAIVTVSRLSRRLLTAMHLENSEAGRSMVSEMWPASIALHYGLKAVYAPHPVFFDRQWSGVKLQERFNAGPSGKVEGSVRRVLDHESYFEGATWFWNARFPRDLYRRWMGMASEGAGSPQWEQTHGPMCLPGILLHPIKSAELDL